MTDDADYSAARPTACPICGQEQEFDECITHNGRGNGNLEFLWECNACEFRFTTIKQLASDGPENHTLLWQETENEEIVKAIHIPEGEDAVSVEAHRAELNMQSLPNYEVHGRAWAIERLYEQFSELYGLEPMPEEDARISWLPDSESES